MEERNKIGSRGQTALILILLTAAALIFFAITLNWGHVAQTKSLLTIAADQGASLLASDAASYGEAEKMQYLNNYNRKSSLDWQIIIGILVIIIAIVITICSWGTAAPLLTIAITEVILVAAIVMAVVNLALQLAVVQPEIESMWNKLQKDQPVQQQFFEEGLGTALMGSVTDQVNITDYLDLNTNGKFGNINGIPLDTISRFAFFYTDRLKMLNRGIIPQVAFFDSQLEDLINGETCYQNYTDSTNYPYSIAINPSCIDPATGKDFCFTDPLDPSCQMVIPNTITCAQNEYESTIPHLNIPISASCPADCKTNPGDPSCQTTIPNEYSFQLNDSCIDSNPGSTSTYNPYCDPCCQQMVELVSPASGSDPAAYRSLRPSYCYPYTVGYPTSCYGKPGTAGCSCSTGSTFSVGGTSNSCNVFPNSPKGQCTLNNPYETYGVTPQQYQYLWDPSYQEYVNGTSFLDQFGRDQPMIPATPVPPNKISTLGEFPNGVYPFFWLMRDYSPQVNNLVSTGLQPPQYHWCADSTPPNYTTATLTEFPDLTQLGQGSFSLPYICTGQNCCVDFLINGAPSLTSATSSPVTINLGNGPQVTITTPATGPTPPAYTAGCTKCVTITGNASEASPGSIASISFTITSAGGPTIKLKQSGFKLTPTPSPTATSVDFTTPTAASIPACDTSQSPSVALPASANYSIGAYAYDPTGNEGSAFVPIIINNPNACTLSTPCGKDSCGHSCGVCNAGYQCSTTTTPGTCVLIPHGGIAIANAVPEASPLDVTSASSPASQAASFVNPATGLSISLVAVDSTGKVDYNYPNGAPATLQAAVLGNSGNIEVLFYYNNGLVLLGPGAVSSCGTSSTDNCGNPCRSPLPSGTLYDLCLPSVTQVYQNVTAIVEDVSSASSPGNNTSNGTIDMVGDSQFLYQNAPPYYNPSLQDPVFGEYIPGTATYTVNYSLPSTGGFPGSKTGSYTVGGTNSVTTTWIEADNQMCLANWPYNGKSSTYPDGICEWTASSTQPYAATPCPDASVCSASGFCADGSRCPIPPSPPPANPNDPNGPVSASPRPIPGAKSTVDSVDDTMHTLSDFVVWAHSILNMDLGTLSATFDTWYPQAAAWIAPQCVYDDLGMDLENGFASPTACNLSTNANCTLADYSCNPGSNGRLLDIYDPAGYPNVAVITPAGWATATILSSNATPVDKLKDWNEQISKWLNVSYTPANSVSYNATNAVWCVPTETSLLNGNPSTAEDTYIKNNSGRTCPGSDPCTNGTCPDGSSCVPWGDMSHVIACLNYNTGATATEVNNASNYYECLNQLTASCSPFPEQCSTALVGTPPASVLPLTSSHTCQPYYIDPSTGNQSFANWIYNQIYFGPFYSYQNCLSLLTGSCPATASLAGTVCDAKVLGRWLTPAGPPAYSGTSTDCSPQSAGSFAEWVEKNRNLFQDERSKFALRSGFLSDIYTRAKTLQTTSLQADNELHAFLKPCGDTQTCANGTSCTGGCTDGSTCGLYCADGGPAAQLIWERGQGAQTVNLPNSVIYGWVDNTPTGGSGGCFNGTNRVGCAHIVKATAYSPGRNGGYGFVLPSLPWIYMFTSWEWIWAPGFPIIPPLGLPFFNYVLDDRDGYVYVSVKRWDQDHTNPVAFPNGHGLWQFMSHNPSRIAEGSGTTGGGLPSTCTSTIQGGGTFPAGTTFGFGLQQRTIQGLNVAMDPKGTGMFPDTTTLTNLGSAFMLSDNGNGQVDPNATLYNSKYMACLNTANTYLNTGTESHACAEYLAWRNAAQASTDDDGPPTWSFMIPTMPTPDPKEHDYSLKFVNCKDVPNFPSTTPPEDLNGHGGGGGS